MYLQQRGICFCLIQAAAVTSQSCLVFLADLNCKRGDSKLEDLLEEVFDLVFCASGQRSKIRHYFGDSLT